MTSTDNAAVRAYKRTVKSVLDGFRNQLGSGRAAEVERQLGLDTLGTDVTVVVTVPGTTDQAAAQRQVESLIAQGRSIQPNWEMTVQS